MASAMVLGKETHWASSRISLLRGEIAAFLAIAASCCASAAMTNVAANATVVVTDANVADYADGFSFDDATGVIEFETSSAPTMNIQGAGTVKKTYNGDWAMTKQLMNFTGTYDLCGAGVVSFTNSYAFGGTETAQKLYVRSGATLMFSASTARLYSRTLHVAGYGAEGAKGAIVVSAGFSETSGGTIRNLFLDDDASFYVGSEANFFYNYGTFNLNGHTLHVRGPGNFSTTTSLVIKNGEMEVANVNNEKPPIYCYRGAKVDNASPPRFVFNGTETLQMSDITDKPNAPLWISGKLTFMTVDYWNSSYWDWTTNGVGWAGPIVFTNETGMSELVLSMAGDHSPKKQINFMGPISGNGSLTLSPGYDTSRVCLGSTNSTFTGSLYWNGSSAKFAKVRLLLLHPGAVPNYSSVTCNYGHIDCVFDNADTEAPWDFAHFADFANRATWLQSSFPALVGPGGDGDFGPVTFGPGLTNAVGANAVATLTGSEGAFSNLTWLCGTARIVGPGRYNVGALKISNGLKTIGTNKYSAVVELDGGVEFVTEKTPSRIGYNSAADASQVSRLVVKNAFLHGPDDQPRVYAKGYDYALAVGCNGSDYGGILEVCDGAVVSNKLLVSGWGGVAAGGDGRGMVIQRGGKVYSLGATTDTHYGPGLGMAGHGSYIMHRGEFTALGSFHVGGYNMGTWAQYGGTAVFKSYPGSTAASFSASICNGGWGEVYLAGGTMDFRSAFIMSGSWAAQRSKLVIDGPNAVFDLHSYRLRANENHADHIAQVTVRNGGVLRTAGTKKIRSDTVYTITFDGGTFLCGAGGQEIFCFFDSGTPDYSAQAPDLVAVFSGGMTVDTSTMEVNYTGVPIRGATGGGVSQVPFDGPISGADGLVRPYVDIVGDGLGATAVALFDTESCAVTNIIVTCPGVDYTTATAKVYVAKSCKKTIVLDDYIVPNVNNGGFTKKGSHYFTLKATNTWGGATTVAGGRLVSGVDWAIPPGTDLRLSGGGVMDFNGKTGEVATVTYGAGGGEIKNAANVRFATDALSFAISAEDIAAGKPVAWSGDLDFSKVTVTVTGDLSTLSSATWHTVVEVSGGVATGEPTIISSELPENWEYRLTPRGVKLGEVKGCILLIR